MDVSSKESVGLAYFYPQTKSCHARELRAMRHGVKISSYYELYEASSNKNLFEGHRLPQYVLPDGSTEWDDADYSTIKQHLEFASKIGIGLFWDLYES